MHYVQKKYLVFSKAPRNISDSNENYRRYNFQAFANTLISGKFWKIAENIKLKEDLQP